MNNTSTDFASLGLRSELLENVATLGYNEMTPVQALTLPPILAGKDVRGQGKTGSGKTAAFGLGILSVLDVGSLEAQAMVICPTRELADQVTKAIRQLARMLPNVKVVSLCGGQPMRAQLSSLEHGAHIVVGTPGRLAKHLRKGTLRIGGLRTLVLDEADRMLDMGFQEEVDAIVAQVPKSRQTLLFSATFPEEIDAIAKDVLRDPVYVKVDTAHDSKSIKQIFYKIESEKQRMDALCLILQDLEVESTIVFCKTKVDTIAVRDFLVSNGYDALALNGDLEQRERDEVVIRFSNGSATILVATDVAARGLDIEALGAVVNFELPRDPEVYVHRVGRTGRAGSSGVASSLFLTSETKFKDEISARVGGRLTVGVLNWNTRLKGSAHYSSKVTLMMRIGRKQKLRAGNLLGALTGPDGIDGKQVGKIVIGDERSYVAVDRVVKGDALRILNNERWKGRGIRAWELT